jgi:hypothetical protein
LFEVINATTKQNVVRAKMLQSTEKAQSIKI